MLIDLITIFLAHSTRTPTIAAIQEWRNGKPVKAWDMAGRSVPVGHHAQLAETAFPLPKGRFVELVVRQPFHGETFDFPSAFWSHAKGIETWYSSSGRWNGVTNGDVVFSVLGVPRSKTGSIRIELATGSYQALTSTHRVMVDHLTQLPGGFRFRLKRRPGNADEYEHCEVSVYYPRRFDHWDITATLARGGKDTDLVGSENWQDGHAKFSFDAPFSNEMGLTIYGRPQRTVVFRNIPLSSGR